VLLACSTEHLRLGVDDHRVRQFRMFALRETARGK
jgi:hypothetical protein